MDEKIEDQESAAQNSTLANLEEIGGIQLELTNIKSALNIVLNEIQQDPSIIQRIATSWNESSGFQKFATGSITIGPGLAAPPLKYLAGFLIPGVSVGALGVLSLSSLLFYYVLGDHYDKSSETKLKNGILGMEDLLEKVIIRLDEIRLKLTAQVDILKSENVRLRKNVDLLEMKIGEFCGQIETFKINNDFLSEQQVNLETVIQQLQKSSEKDEKLIEEKEKILKEYIRDKAKNQADLDNKIMELDMVKKTMGLELEQAKKVSGMLQNTVQMLSKTSIKNESDREAFKQKIDDLLTKGENDLKAVNERVYAMEEQFETVLSELQESNALYKVILQKEEAQLAILQGLTATPNSAETRSFLGSFSLFRQPWSALTGFNTNTQAMNLP